MSDPAFFEKEIGGFIDYDKEPQWRQKPLTPAQLLVHDIRLESRRPGQGPLLEVNERSTASLVPFTACQTSPASLVRAADATTRPIERQQYTFLEDHYGWIRHLRLLKHQRHVYDDEDSAKCRWIHCSSKVSTDYLKGVLWALWEDVTTVADVLRSLNHVIDGNARFSKHGKYFTPFFEPLLANPRHAEKADVYPMLLSIPFLDWTVSKETPPLRFQVDRREGFASTRSTAHRLRSVLQHYYRLEDTADREDSQVFARHKPWQTNRELDLKVRQWYGYYPTGLNVDELWVLVVDPQHIVTWSSNQTWKSRWPPMQFTSRVSDVTFRGLRNAFYMSDEPGEYTATTHLVACLSGAVGMLHRSFWADMVLCLTDRYAGHLGHLQYRLHRSPSTKLVMDLIACQDELNVVIQLTQQQRDLITELESHLIVNGSNARATPSPTTRTARYRAESVQHQPDFDPFSQQLRRSTYRQLGASQLTDPLTQLLGNLNRELIDLQELRDSTDRLVTRTIQLVNIRLEDHGKAILVFTVVTIIFLPLNFVCSYFGMNVYDIRNLNKNQWIFWAVGSCVTITVLSLSLILAFYGGGIMESFMLWRDARRERRLTKPGVTADRRTSEHSGIFSRRNTQNSSGAG